jgi:hypothetical protein
MPDIIEFKVHIEKNNSNFFDEVFEDFVLFIESKSVYWGGGGGPNYIGGGLYTNRKININDFIKEVIYFFISYDKTANIVISIYNVFADSFDRNLFADELDKFKVSFYSEDEND